jgi:hypothetical protein
MEIETAKLQLQVHTGNGEDNTQVPQGLNTLALNGVLERLTSDAGEQAAMVEQVRIRKCQWLKGGDSAIEQMLVDHLVNCWLRLQYAEQAKTVAASEASSPKYLKYCERSLQRSQKRFNRAVESLNRMRALAKR